jgi:hypothetical protein
MHPTRRVTILVVRSNAQDELSESIMAGVGGHAGYTGGHENQQRETRSDDGGALRGH